MMTSSDWNGIVTPYYLGFLKTTEGNTILNNFLKLERNTTGGQCGKRIALHDHVLCIPMDSFVYCHMFTEGWLAREMIVGTSPSTLYLKSS
jgi:hypothetical protein